MSVAHLKLGFIALNDCAPLVVAHEKGLFAAEDLSVSLHREASWATIRDKLAIGAFDGAHFLAPLALGANLGVAGQTPRVIAPLALNVNGAAFTISTALAGQLREIDPAPDGPRGRAAALAHLIVRRQGQGAPPLTFGVVHPFSIHNYALRYWLAGAGVDPDRDVRIVVVPPPRTAERLASGEIDGFCVGGPWGNLSADQHVGEVLLRVADIWGLCPDKVFGVTEAWSSDNPDTLQALMRALLRAGVWADDPANRPELIAMLARPDYVGSPPEVVEAGLTNIAYSRNAASFPFASHALWFLTQMRRWGQIDEGVDIPLTARRVYRADLHRIAAAAVGLPTPLAESKIEGAHAEPWSLPATEGAIPMAPDAMFDGRVFDPIDPEAYIASFEIGRR